jgi:hypothetical protein
MTNLLEINQIPSLTDNGEKQFRDVREKWENAKAVGQAPAFGACSLHVGSDGSAAKESTVHSSRPG